MEQQDGDVVIISGGTLNSTDGWRMQCLVPGKTMLFAVTNGGTFSLIRDSADFRVGLGGGDPTATNVLDVAGRFYCYSGTGNGRVDLGLGGAKSIVNLRAGGSLTCRAVVPGVGATGRTELNFNGGTLSPIADNAFFLEGLVNAWVRSGGITIDTSDFNIGIAQPLLDGGGGGGLTKTGFGTLRLEGANTYSGTTRVVQGVLGGTGSLAGPVVVTAGGTLAPGDSISTLTIHNNLTLGGTVIDEVSTHGGVTTNDYVCGLQDVSYDGTLVITNTGTTPLAAGEVFNLFQASGNRTGNFKNIVILPDTGLTGQFDPASGELTLSGQAAPMLYATRTPAYLALTWSGPCTLVAQTNRLNVGITSNWYTYPGGTNGVEVPIVTTNPAVFFRLKSENQTQTNPASPIVGANVNETLNNLDMSLLDYSQTTWVRGFLPFSEFFNGSRDPATDGGIARLRTVAKSGRKVIVSIKWIFLTQSWRVPAVGSPTEAAYFACLDRICQALNGVAKILVVANEPFIDTDPRDEVADPATGRIPLVDFLERVVAHLAAKPVRQSDGSPVPLYVGAFTRLDKSSNQTNPAVRALLDFAANAEQVAGIDLHLHQSAFAQMGTALSFARQYTSKPIIVTEFSLIWRYQQHLGDSLGIDAQGLAFANSFGRDPQMEVYQYLNTVLGAPASQLEWDAFMSSRSWYDPALLQKAWEYFRTYGVTVATYAFTQNPPVAHPSPGNLTPQSVPWILNPVFVRRVVSPQPGAPPPTNPGLLENYLQLH